MKTPRARVTILLDGEEVKTEEYDMREYVYIPDRDVHCFLVEWDLVEFESEELHG